MLLSARIEGAAGRCWGGLAGVGVLVVCCMMLSLCGVAHGAALPDGRVYELVTPTKKDGHPAGVNEIGLPIYALAADDGSGVFFGTVGPVSSGGVSSGAATSDSVSQRTAGSWVTFDAVPRPQGFPQAFQNPYAIPLSVEPSADLRSLVFNSDWSFTPEHTVGGTGFGAVYLSVGGDSPAWLSTVPGLEITHPRIPDPQPGSALGRRPILAGGAPDLSVVYLAYYGTLVAEDAGREEVLEAHGGANAFQNDWGFYESRDGVLSSAGVLPGSPVESPHYQGIPNPHGARAAAILGLTGFEFRAPDEFDGEVSRGGADAFFVSPDPGMCPLPPVPAEPECGGELPQLYVREGGSKTVLVSRTEGGAPAPDGPWEMRNAGGRHLGSFVFASGDGAHAFFASHDALTKPAPADSSVKMYEFDTASGTVAYLPGVSPAVVGSTADGSRFVFEESEVTAGDQTIVHGLGFSSGGVSVRIAPLVAPGPGVPVVGPVRVSSDGGVVVFESDAVPAGFGGFNNGGGFEEVYRYDVGAGVLSCVSCPPAGVSPLGDAVLSNDDVVNGTGGDPVDSRGVALGGARVFFDSPDALVPQDTNGRRDVYEWEGGVVRLVSAGSGTQDSFFLDNSESGGDVFFATADGLSRLDTDGGYDVYDARVGGRVEATAAGVCEGEACQGQPTTPPLFASPASMTVEGAGNPPLPGASNAAAHNSKPKPKPKRRGRRRRARRGRASGSRSRARVRGRVVAGGGRDRKAGR
jgi:hypothetical protein